MPAYAPSWLYVVQENPRKAFSEYVTRYHKNYRGNKAVSAAARDTVTFDVNPAVCLQHILLTDSFEKLQLFYSWMVVIFSLNECHWKLASSTAIHLPRFCTAGI
jgi:hypothetical protein